MANGKRQIFGFRLDYNQTRVISWKTTSHKDHLEFRGLST